MKQNFVLIIFFFKFQLTLYCETVKIPQETKTWKRLGRQRNMTICLWCGGESTGLEGNQSLAFAVGFFPLSIGTPDGK